MRMLEILTALWGRERGCVRACLRVCMCCERKEGGKFCSRHLGRFFPRLLTMMLIMMMSMQDGKLVDWKYGLLFSFGVSG